MEVHHHPHTPRKKWTHYFWEFFMMFLAVFCGFLAENQREHYVEHQRENQYMRSMIEDLKSDIISLDHVQKLSEGLKLATDSLLLELQTTTIYTNSNRAYSLWLSSSWTPDFMQNDRTIQQLKNSGGLRLIRKKNVSDSIMEYDRQIRFISTLQTHFSEFLIQTKHYTFSLFPHKDINVNPNAAFPLLSNDKKFIQEIYGFKLEFRNILNGLFYIYADAMHRAERLLEFIEKEYHLK